MLRELMLAGFIALKRFTTIRIKQQGKRGIKEWIKLWHRQIACRPRICGYILKVYSGVNKTST